MNLSVQFSLLTRYSKSIDLSSEKPDALIRLRSHKQPAVLSKVPKSLAIDLI